MGNVVALPIGSIRTDGGTQPRTELSEYLVDEYAEAMRNGDKFPPVTVFYDGSDYWLADGFHRVTAAKRGEYATISADVRQGTRRDAILFSVSANAAHGQRRSNADKRRAVETLLRDAEWVEWSDNQIAIRCAVSQSTVSRVRQELETDPTYALHKSPVRIGGDGRTINTANIGKPAPMPQGLAALKPGLENIDAFIRAAGRYSDDTPDLANIDVRMRAAHHLSEDETDEGGYAPSPKEIADGIARHRALTPEAQSDAFSRLLLKLDEHRNVEPANIDAWLDVTPPDQWFLCTENFKRLREFMDRVESLMNTRRSARLRVMR